MPGQLHEREWVIHHPYGASIMSPEQSCAAGWLSWS